jgi:hypothetical protein
MKAEGGTRCQAKSKENLSHENLKLMGFWERLCLVGDLLQTWISKVE